MLSGPLGFRAAALVGIALVSLTGCGPRPLEVAPLTGGARGARYLSQLLQRERRAVMVEGAVTMWVRGGAACDTCPRRRFPGVNGRFALSWPDAFRLRVASIFGTALDLGVRGDSVTVYAPARRAAATLDVVRDSLGSVGSGDLLVRIASAGWRPPDSAWARGIWEGSLLVLRWDRGGESVAVAVDDAGRPAWARLWRGEGRGVRADYERWDSVDGIAWPVVVRVRELQGGHELACAVEQVRFAARADHARLAVRVPADAERVGVDRLRGFLERLETAP